MTLRDSDLCRIRDLFDDLGIARRQQDSVNLLLVGLKPTPEDFVCCRLSPPWKIFGF